MKTATILADTLRQEVMDKRAIAMMAVYLIILSIGMKAGPMIGKVAKLLFIDTTLPAEVIVIYYMSAALTPILAILLSFDAISGETSTNSIAYLVTRTGRHSILLGKWLASAILMCTVNLLAHATASVYFLIKTGNPVVTGMAMSWIYVTAISLAFVSIGYFCSTITRKHQTALWAAVSITAILLLIVSKDIVPWLSPYNYISHALEGKIKTGLASLAAMTLAWLAASLLIFKRKDL